MAALLSKSAKQPKQNAFNIFPLNVSLRVGDGKC